MYKVIIVEDEDPIRRGLNARFHGQGWTVPSSAAAGTVRKACGPLRSWSRTL